jgi:hypothetical protein
MKNLKNLLAKIKKLLIEIQIELAETGKNAGLAMRS